MTIPLQPYDIVPRISGRWIGKAELVGKVKNQVAQQLDGFTEILRFDRTRPVETVP